MPSAPKVPDRDGGVRPVEILHQVDAQKRGASAGITLPDLSQLFYDLGCTAAYNLDGGNSSIMVWNNEVINDPSGGGRESSDALLIAEVKSYE